MYIYSPTAHTTGPIMTKPDMMMVPDLGKGAREVGTRAHSKVPREVRESLLVLYKDFCSLSLHHTTIIQHLIATTRVWTPVTDITLNIC